MALQRGNYKLVAKTDYDAPIEAFELFDLENDPYEQNNIVVEKKDIAVELRSDLDKVYSELIHSKNLINSPRTIIGSKHENPVFLNRNDADGQRGIWAQEEIYGKWKVSFYEGYYNIRFKFIKPVKANGRMYLETGAIINQMKNETDGTDIIEMINIHLPKMDCDLIPFYSNGSKKILPFWIEIEKIR